jgi:hypothetical protein
MCASESGARTLRALEMRHLGAVAFDNEWPIDAHRMWATIKGESHGSTAGISS